MIDSVLIRLLSLNTFISVILMIVFNVVVILMWPKILKLSFFKKYKGIQRIHDGEVSRLGGLISFFGLSMLLLSIDHNSFAFSFFEIALISALPIALISLKEDLFHNTRPQTRLISMLLSSLIFFNLYPINFPILDIPFIGEIINSSSLISLLFFCFCVIVVVNGNNLIDGANGLMPMTVLMQCFSLIYLCLQVNDFEYLLIICYLILPLIIFLIFNYPLGLIFMGDFGAYLYGFFVGLLCIAIFGEYPQYPTWAAIIILFYPSFELLFSFIRKSIIKKNPFNPDQHHLHLKMFYLMKEERVNSKVPNSLVMPSLTLIWCSPFIFFIWFHRSLLLTILSLIVLVIIYLGFFWALSIRNFK